MRDNIKVYKDYSMDAEVDTEGVLVVLSGKGSSRKCSPMDNFL